MRRKFWIVFPYLILALGISLTILAWSQATIRVESETTAQRQKAMEHLSDAIVNRMQTYADAHYQGVGFLSASENVTATEWFEYVQATDLLQRYPGIRAFCYATFVPQTERESFVAHQRQFRSDFEIRPDGQRTDYAIVTYVAPPERAIGSVGYDMGSEPLRRSALERANETGEPSLTPVIELLTGSHVRGFLLYVPWYHKESPRRLRGWVYSSFEAKVLFQKVFDDDSAGSSGTIRIRVYGAPDKREESLLFDNTKGTEAIYFGSNQIPMYGQVWRMEYFFSANANKVRDDSSIVLGVSLLTAGLAFGLAKLGASIQARATKIAEEMTAAYEARTVEVEKQNEELDAFVHLASHDLKSPLRGIANLAYLVEEESTAKLSDESRQWLTMIQERASFMSRLLDGLLQFATIDKTTLDRRAVDSAKVLQDVIAALGLQDKADVKIMSELPTLVTAEAILSQIFLNLLSNALKYSSVRPLEICVACQQVGSDYVFSVSDNGIGIETEHQERIFVMFTRLQVKPDVEGTGIGLALLKKHLSALGGTIRVESVVGQGSTFHFTLPNSDLT